MLINGMTLPDLCFIRLLLVILLVKHEQGLKSRDDCSLPGKVSWIRVEMGRRSEIPSEGGVERSC